MTARELAEVAVRTCQWVHIFRVQEKRFLEDFDRDRDGKYPWEGDDEVSLFVGDRIFMISAIHHVINGLDYLKKELNIRNESTKEIEAVLKEIAGEEIRRDLKLLRNMNEHDIEYMTENGRKQDQLQRQFKKNGVTYSINAQWTFVDGEKEVFLIGNIDMFELAKSVKKQIKNIDNICRQIFEKYFCLYEGEVNG